ncbi:hypothetical protein [Streptomyces sp. NPDC056227]|uniref:hypothetical protein n=1 Tax=Streptomyces sp. NPDC056227 TaxID=3345753 RepID=UPI0035DAEF41
MDDAQWIQERAQLIYAAASQHRIGSRVTDGDTEYTLVALVLGSDYARPLYLSDNWETNTQFSWVDGKDEIEDFDPAPDNAELAARARAHAATERDYISQHGQMDICLDNPGNAEQVRRVLEFGEADRAWRIAESAQRKAAAERAASIAILARAAGTQSAAGRLIGLDQSRISRAMDVAHHTTGGHSA